LKNTERVLPESIGRGLSATEWQLYLETIPIPAPVALDYVVLHPIPNPATPDDPERGYMARVAREVLPRVRARLGAGAT
jgi:type IV secretory pathway protease TraF